MNSSLSLGLQKFFARERDQPKVAAFADAEGALRSFLLSPRNACGALEAPWDWERDGVPFAL
jgi:hypothetical protein